MCDSSTRTAHQVKAAPVSVPPPHQMLLQHVDFGASHVSPCQPPAVFLELFDTPTRPVTDQVVATGVTLPADYIITFALTPLGASAGWADLFKFTKSSNACCEYWDRLTHAFFLPGTLKLGVAVTHPGGTPYGYSTQYYIHAYDELRLGQRVEVTIAVSPVEVSLHVDDVQVASNTHPDDGRGDLDDVTVKTTNAGDVAANIVLQDLRVQRPSYDGGEGRKIVLHPREWKIS